MCTVCVIIKSNKTQSKMRYSVGTDICFGLLYFFMLANVSTGKHSTYCLSFFFLGVFKFTLLLIEHLFIKMTKFSINGLMGTFRGCESKYSQKKSINFFCLYSTCISNYKFKK